MVQKRSQFHKFSLWLISFSIIFLSTLHAESEVLEIGEFLPPIKGETLAGELLELPAASKGKVMLVVFSFTKKGGSFARQWIERFEKEFGSNSGARCYGVMFLQGVPRLLRGLVSSGIKKGIPKNKYPNFLRVYKDEKLWKDWLQVIKEDNPYVVLLDGAGKILWLTSDQFSESLFSELKNEANSNLN
jgi:hypothetical protein